MEKSWYKDYLHYTFIGVYFNFCMFLIQPVLSPYIKSLGFDDVQLSLLMSFLPITLIIISPLIGRLSDIHGRKSVIHLGIIAYILSLNIYLLANNWFLIALARILDAVAIAAVTLMIVARVEDALSDNERGKLAGWTFSLQNVTKLLAPVIAGLLADFFFIKAPFITSIYLLLLLTIALFSLKNGNEKHFKEKKGNYNWFSQVYEFLSYRQLQGMAVLGIMMHAANTAIAIFLPLLIVEKMGMDYRFIGYALFLMGIASLFQFYFGKIADKSGPWRGVLAGCALSGTSLAMVVLTNNYWSLIACLLVHGTGNAVWNVSAWSLMSNVGERISEEGQVVTTYASLAKIGSVLMSVLAGFIVTFSSIPVLLMVSGILVVAAAAYSHHKLVPAKDL